MDVSIWNQMRNISLLSIFLYFIFHSTSIAQPDRWQQHVDYKMEIDFNVDNHRYSGVQQLIYTNNSPDTLHRVFYHLYFNAFQPGSMMDARSRNIPDPDSRIRNKILDLTKEEQGFQKIDQLTQDGRPVRFDVVGTILEVTLHSPILPGESSLFHMEFRAQVPVQIRRTGRNNREGIEYSMAQWYPKLCEYDYQGWHANPYVAREFYGVWGNFDVKIRIDPAYTVAASGYLQNPNQIGHGYEDEGVTVKHEKSDKLEWHFVAPQVHDFVWAADPDYTHDKHMAADGTILHFFYQKNKNTEAAWSLLPEYTDKALQFVNDRIGQYPYEQYSIIQGGDGGMEYAMATLITGERSQFSLVGVMVHELLHSWYQMILGTNESLYPWMDEGFTNYVGARTMKYLYDPNSDRDPYAGNYEGYRQFVKTGNEEPLITHSDHYMTNHAYGVGAYTKGSIFLHQMSYIIGQDAFDRGMKRYYNTWKFKHPNPNDFIRIMEKESQLELDWYKEYWIHTTHTIDYGLHKLEATSNGTRVELKKIGYMPMPLDIKVTLVGDKVMWFNIPLRLMRGEKQPEAGMSNFSVLPDWPWTHPDYSFEIPVSMEEVVRIEIDPSGRLADVNLENNSYEITSADR